MLNVKDGWNKKFRIPLFEDETVKVYAILTLKLLLTVVLVTVVILGVIILLAHFKIGGFGR